MAIPSGAGTEVLKRAYLHAMTNSEATLLTGVANHIYTVLSVVFCEQGAATETVNMYVDYDLGGTNVFLLFSQSITGEATFVWNDKFVITGTDKLHAIAQNSANIDVWVSYIDQDWT